MSELTDKILEDDLKAKGAEQPAPKPRPPKGDKKQSPKPKDRFFTTFLGVKGQLAHECQLIRQATYEKKKAELEAAMNWADNPETREKQEQGIEDKARAAYAQAIPEKPLAVSKILYERIHFVRVKPAGNNQKAPLYFYNPDKGVYVENTEFLQDLIFIIAPNFTERQAQDTIYKVARQSPERDNQPLYTALGNQLYNAKTGKLEDFTPKVVTIRKINTEYNPTAKEPNIKGWRVTEWLRELFGGDDELYRLAIQIIRACVTGQSLEKLFWLYGRGGTGKGTFQQLIINLVGLDNVASLRITGLGKSQFTTSILLGKSVVIGDDVQAGAVIKDTSDLFSLVTGDLLTIEEKGKKPYSLTLSMTVIQSSNGMPTMEGDSEAIGRRFRILPFAGEFVGKPDKAIKQDYIHRSEVLEFLLKLALETPLEDINPKASQEELAKYQADINPVLAFVEDFFTDELESEFLPNSFVWWVWRDYLDYTGHTSPLKDNAFHREVGKHLPPNFSKGEKVTPAGRHLAPGFNPKADLPHYARSYYTNGRETPEKQAKKTRDRGYIKNR